MKTNNDEDRILVIVRKHYHMMCEDGQPRYCARQHTNTSDFAFKKYLIKNQNIIKSANPENDEYNAILRRHYRELRDAGFSVRDAHSYKKCSDKTVNQHIKENKKERYI